MRFSLNRLDSDPPSISVVVPAFNEALRISASLSELTQMLVERGAEFEVIVVDDGSTDNTAQLVRAWEAEGVRLIRLERNRGKGAALRSGVAASRFGRVLLCDADLSTPANALARLEAIGRGADLVLASRVAEGATLHRGAARRFMGGVFNRVLHLLGLCRGLQDTQCGFKLIHGPTARSLFEEMRIDGFGFDVELIELARLRGLEVVEVGVTWCDDGESSVRPIRDSVAMLLEALAIREDLRRFSGGIDRSTLD